MAMRMRSENTTQGDILREIGSNAPAASVIEMTSDSDAKTGHYDALV